MVGRCKGCIHTKRQTLRTLQLTMTPRRVLCSSTHDTAALRIAFGSTSHETASCGCASCACGGSHRQHHRQPPHARDRCHWHCCRCACEGEGEHRGVGAPAPLWEAAVPVHTGRATESRRQPTWNGQSHPGQQASTHHRGLGPWGARSPNQARRLREAGSAQAAGHPTC